MISIAMTTFNGEKFLKNQVESVLKQSLEDFELIICDDDSTDETMKILKEYEQKDKRIKIYKNDTNLGFKKNFEKAISLCNGELIALCDQDDVWPKDHLKILTEMIEGYSIACGNSLIIDSEGKSAEKKLNEIEGLHEMKDSKKILYKILLDKNPFQGAAMLLKKDFIEKCMPIPEKIKYHDCWFAACACLCDGINYTFDVVNNYRLHENNVTYKNLNRNNRTYIEKLKGKISSLFKKSETDRFDYKDELKRIFGTEDEDFKTVSTIIDDIEKHKFSIKDKEILWKNYYWIQTEKGHKNYFKRLILWKNWKRG